VKCKNCGFPRSAHSASVGVGGQRIWKCPDGSGDSYPAMADVKVELHYRTGEDSPWLAKWVHPTVGPGEVVSAEPGNALERAGRKIEEADEEKSPEDAAIEKAIKER
jgi:hypothetical protein